MDNTFNNNSAMSSLDDEFFGILKNSSIKTVFQPIVSIDTCSIIGYEALSRGPERTRLSSPEAILAVAEKTKKLLEIEQLFIKKALSNFKKHITGKKVFLNINEMTIQQDEFIKFFNEEVRKTDNSNITEIVIELTERMDIDNYSKLLSSIQTIKEISDVKLAIDDAGSGYSGLTRICRVKPEYIKLDRELINNIDNDTNKQAMVKSMCEYARLTRQCLIAEGIENAAELKTVINLGVKYVQGYFIKRPSTDSFNINEEASNIIKGLSTNKLGVNNITNTDIGTLCEPKIVISPNKVVSKVDKIFKDNDEILEMCVVENNIVLGVITRNNFYSKLGWQFGYSLYSSKPISYIMNRNFLSIDYKMPIDEVIKLAMARENDKLYDHVVITKEEKYYGVVTIKDLIEKTTEIKVENAKYSNPLTGLPGNRVIERKIYDCLNQIEKYSILYFDIDNFKPYNDVYGFENGDNIIKGLAVLITKNMPSNSFIGHIGGDDFIAIIDSWNVEHICSKIINDFNIMTRKYYEANDIENGYICAENRHGIEEKFPLASISIAVLTNKNMYFDTVYSLAKESSRIKKQCKKRSGGCYIIA